jgi:serine/threonine protein kinase/WD40 repeat protein
VSDANPSLEEFLFEAALERTSPAARAAFLEEVCRGNPPLRARLDLLLEGHFQADTFLSAAFAESEDPPKGTPTEPPTSKDESNSIYIGRYKLLERIGEGGFGEVWMAEQKVPVKRRVALKIIKLGMDTRQVVARFEAERQALALMDHPNIAKVLDAGATDAGRPYFVMELVRGVRITDFCDQNKLPSPERLKLFVQVCRAIQHAHQKGIIHRDIKPSNILVTLHDGVSVPKVIDFGIAKATQQELTEKTVVTQFRQFIGTPAYISPEQAEMSGLDIDTRSDIYSLGVLLYELLTGRTPFDTQELINAGLDGMRRIICQKEPLKPSTRLAMDRLDTPLPGAARSVVRHLQPAVDRDLDWIVMKCLEKDRARRYETANGLARDVERHLHHEPVLARPPSTLYLFQKTARRHWVGFVAGCSVLVALAMGAALSSLEAVRAHHAQADQARQKLAAQRFLYKSLLGEARATRLARQLGYRENVFRLLEQAKALDVPDKDLDYLRQEAVACLGDFVGLTPARFTDFTTNIGNACLDPAGNLAAFGLWDGTIQLRQMPGGREVARLGPKDEALQDFCFGSDGNHLFAAYGSPDNFYEWALGADGRWREMGHGALLPETKRLLSGGPRVLAVNISGFPRSVPLTLQRSLVRKVFEFTPFEAGQSDSRSLEFRLLNPQTGQLIPGYAVTNPVPSSGEITFYASADYQLLAVETWDKQDPNSPARVQPASTQLDNDDRQAPNLVQYKPRQTEDSVSSPLSLVNLYDWKTGQLINHFRRRINGSLSGTAPLSLSDDSKAIVSLTEVGGTIFTVPGLEQIAQFMGPYYGKTPRICGDTVALPEADRIRLWSLRRSEDIAVLDLPNDAWPAAFTPDGNWLLAAGVRHAFLFRLTTPEKTELPHHAGAVPAVAFSPDGLRLASVGKDRALHVCDTRTGCVLWQTNDLPGLGQCVSYSPDGQWLAVGVWDRDLVSLREARTGRWILDLGTGQRGKTTYCVRFSPDGRYLAVGADVTRVWALDAAHSAETKTTLHVTPLSSWDGIAMDPIFSPDSRLLAFCSLYDENLHPPERWGDSDRPLYLWDFASNDQPRRIASRVLGQIQCAGFTPDGRQLLAVNASGDIVALEIATGKVVSSAHAHEPQFDRAAVSICPSPDGSKIAVTITPPSGGAVSILDSRLGKRLYLLPAETGAIYWLAWSPDSNRLAVSRDNGKIAIWNLAEIQHVLAGVGLSP